MIDGQVVPGLAPHGHGTTALGRARGSVLQRRASAQPGPLPHRLRRRARGQGRAGHLRPDDIDPVDRRGQLRAARTRSAAALHARAGRDDVLRTGHRRYAGRAARCDARDLPLPRPGSEHRPLLDVPVHVHAGLGELRNGLGGCPPVAGRSASARARRDRDRSSGSAGPELQSPDATSASGKGIGGRGRQPHRQPVHHQDRCPGRWGQERRDRAHPSARSDDRLGVPGRRADLGFRDPRRRTEASR